MVRNAALAPFEPGAVRHSKLFRQLINQFVHVRSMGTICLFVKSLRGT
jgi:hypothetical protein